MRYRVLIMTVCVGLVMMLQPAAGAETGSDKRAQKSTRVEKAERSETLKSQEEYRLLLIEYYENLDKAETEEERVALHREFLEKSRSYRESLAARRAVSAQPVKEEKPVAPTVKPEAPAPYNRENVMGSDFHTLTHGWFGTKAGTK